jgi:hypothetical protein
MELALVAGVLAACVGIIRGGSLNSLAETKFRWWWLLFVALAVQILFTYWSPEGWSRADLRWILLASTAGVAAFLAANYRVPGVVLAALGLTLNVIVIASNSAMPVSESAARAVGASARGVEGGFKHEPLNDDTKLPVLADVIPIPITSSVLSAGDVLLIAGIAYLVYRRTAAGRRRGRHSFTAASG